MYKCMSIAIIHRQILPCLYIDLLTQTNGSGLILPSPGGICNLLRDENVYQILGAGPERFTAFLRDLNTRLRPPFCIVATLELRSATSPPLMYFYDSVDGESVLAGSLTILENSLTFVLFGQTVQFSLPPGQTFLNDFAHYHVCANGTHLSLYFSAREADGTLPPSYHDAQPFTYFISPFDGDGQISIFRPADEDTPNFIVSTNL